MISSIIRFLIGLLFARAFGWLKTIVLAGMAVWALSGFASPNPFAPLAQSMRNIQSALPDFAAIKVSRRSEQTAKPKGAVLQGKVVGVADGDTLTLLDDDNRQHTIRLAHIDAPDKCQPFYEKSRQTLARACFKKPASAVVIDTDQYGRTVAEVTCSGVDANAHQVGEGMAWIFTKYFRGNPELLRTERQARQNGIGLWRDKDPIPPWDWRKTGAHKLACAS